MKKCNNPKTTAKWVILCIACCLAANVSAQNKLTAYKTTFKVVEVQNGKHCQSSSSIMLKLQNTYSQTMDLQYSFQDNSGKWQTGVVSNVLPGQNTGERIVMCQTNGRYKWWARPSAMASQIAFPVMQTLNK